jgi:hypothetical protein
LPPEIIPEDFSKPLNLTLSLDFNYQNPAETTHFYSQLDQTIYELVELNSLSGSAFSGCVELFEYKYNPTAENVIIDEAGHQLEQTSDIYQVAENLLKLGFDPDTRKRIARYIFKDKEIIYDGLDVIGKQIKGAYIEDNNAVLGLSTIVYRYLRDKYDLLICDNMQTVNGHQLWAFGVCKWANVQVYDCYQNLVVSQLSPTGDVPDGNIIPWSIPYLSIEKMEMLRKGFWTDQGNLNHIVLLIKS